MKSIRAIGQVPKCQARIRREASKNADELQSYFTKRIEPLHQRPGRTLIGWDESWRRLAPNATVMCCGASARRWSPPAPGHDVVMTPTSHCYLDYYQAKRASRRPSAASCRSDRSTASEPLPANIPPTRPSISWAPGGNLWSEFLPSYAMAQYMAYPRACAIAELTWTEQKRKDWGDFRRRLQTHLQRLQVQG